MVPNIERHIEKLHKIKRENDKNIDDLRNKIERIHLETKDIDAMTEKLSSMLAMPKIQSHHLLQNEKEYMNLISMH